jgi:glycosyltransferase involved in cell wall biosynthesis
VYLGIIKKIASCKTLVTCHDFIAIRSAKGAFGNLQQTSITGKLLQKWILSSLVKADFYACDSLQTEKDLKKLISRSQNRSCVIHLGTRDQENVQENSDSQIYLSSLPFNPSQIDYLLHVGNDAWYKNRKSLFNLLKEISNSTEYQDIRLVLVGPPPQKHELNSSTADFLHTNPNKLIVLENLSDLVLKFLYQHAKVFVFPSFIEGFGWPPLEAALSNCPVVTSRTGAMFDILKESVNYIDPYNQDSINSTVCKILQKNERTANKLNIPSLSECTNKYYKLYHQLAN